MDVGFENPIFACLEVDYTEIDRDPTGEALETSEKVRSNTTHPSVARSRAWLLLTPSRPLPTSPNPPLQLLTYYELDLGLNHVVRKWSEPVDTRANLLIPGTVLFGPCRLCVCACATGRRSFKGSVRGRHDRKPVPGGTDGPSGVLVCAENFITWKHQGHAEVRVPIPRRENPLEDPDRGLLIVSYAMHRTKVRRNDFEEKRSERRQGGCETSEGRRRARRRVRKE